MHHSYLSGYFRLLGFMATLNWLINLYHCLSPRGKVNIHLFCETYSFWVTSHSSGQWTELAAVPVQVPAIKWLS